METKVKQAKVEEAEPKTTDPQAEAPGQKNDESEPQEDASQKNDESGPQVDESPIAITAVREWLAQRSFNEKLTAVMLWQLARIEHVFEGADAKIGNDLYSLFNADVLGETDVPADCELIRGVYAAWQIMPV
jgi:hypothetical protein